MDTVCTYSFLILYPRICQKYCKPLGAFERDPVTRHIQTQKLTLIQVVENRTQKERKKVDTWLDYFSLDQYLTDSEWFQHAYHQVS